MFCTYSTHQQTSVLLHEWGEPGTFDLPLGASEERANHGVCFPRPYEFFCVSVKYYIIIVRECVRVRQIGRDGLVWGLAVGKPREFPLVTILF